MRKPREFTNGRCYKSWGILTGRLDASPGALCCQKTIRFIGPQCLAFTFPIQHIEPMARISHWVSDANSNDSGTCINDDEKETASSRFCAAGFGREAF